MNRKFVNRRQKERAEAEIDKAVNALITSTEDELLDHFEHDPVFGLGDLKAGLYTHDIDTRKITPLKVREEELWNRDRPRKQLFVIPNHQSHVAAIDAKKEKAREQAALAKKLLEKQLALANAVKETPLQERLLNSLENLKMSELRKLNVYNLFTRKKAHLQFFRQFIDKWETVATMIVQREALLKEMKRCRASWIAYQRMVELSHTDGGEVAVSRKDDADRPKPERLETKDAECANLLLTASCGCILAIHALLRLPVWTVNPHYGEEEYLEKMRSDMPKDVYERLARVELYDDVDVTQHEGAYDVFVDYLKLKEATCEEDNLVTCMGDAINTSSDEDTDTNETESNVSDNDAIAQRLLELSDKESESEDEEVVMEDLPLEDRIDAIFELIQTDENNDYHKAKVRRMEEAYS